MKLVIIEGPGKRDTLKKYLGNEYDVFATKGHVRDLPAKSIAIAADAGDATAIEVYAISARHLGAGISIMIDILNPEKIVIGSIFARSENLLRTEMQKVIDREALANASQVCQVVPALLGESIGDIAAVSVASNGLLQRGK